MIRHNHNEHAHSDNEGASLSFEEKLVKLLEHWIIHNKEHNENYKKWSDAAADHGYNNISALIEEAADISLNLNKRFEQALTIMKLEVRN